MVGLIVEELRCKFPINKIGHRSTCSVEYLCTGEIFLSFPLCRNEELSLVRVLQFMLLVYFINAVAQYCLAE